MASSIVQAGKYPNFGSAYPFAYSSDRAGSPREGAVVRFAWDESGLFVFVELEDSNLIAKNKKDEQFHFRHGDVFELFVKPRHDAYYWEMYATPNGNKSTLFFPRDRSGMQPDDFLNGHRFQSLEVAAEKSSKGWNAELFVPAEQLTALGAGWGDRTEWSVFCGRYNYQDETLKDPELSMVPALSKTNYHLVDEYARLEMTP